MATTTHNPVRPRALLAILAATLIGLAPVIAAVIGAPSAEVAR